MNAIRQIQALNKRELENAVPPEASWHADYRDSAYINIGGLPYDLSEGDIVTIFSQFGEPVHVNLIRDKETGKSKGFAFLKYEDQRSTDLAVDNLCGATIMGRVLRVDHTRYKRRDDEGEEDNVASLTGPAGEAVSKDADVDERKRRRSSDSEERPRPLLKEERELAELMRDHDEEDPMKEYLIQEKKEEVARALEKLKSQSSSRRHRRRDDSRDRERSSKHRHHHHRHHHRHRRSEDRSQSRERSHKSRSETSRRDRHHNRDRDGDRNYRDREDYDDRK